MAWHMLPIIWDNFHEKGTDSWCWRSDNPHVINQLADKQTIKQTLLPVSQQNPQTYPTNKMQTTSGK